MTALNNTLDWIRVRLGGKATPRLEEDGRVLHLFRNRAELKKAYSDLQDEIHRLRDRIKQQEGATARVQEMMQELEQRLSQPPSGFTALVFYQLRDLWFAGRDLISQMIADLASQQEERERRQFVAEFNRQQFERRQRTEGALRNAESVSADVRVKLAELNAARGRASRWWHYFKRRELDRRIHAMTAELQGANGLLQEARAAFDAVNNEPAPEFPGVSVEARRAINLAAIAYAELLCLRLSKTPLVQLSREAVRRREPRDDYGDQTACLAVMSDVSRAKMQLQNRAQVAGDVKVRSERLRAHAKYRSAIDTIPTEDSLAFARDAHLDAVVEGSATVETMTPILRDDTWDIQRLLLR
ncbi:MAG: hypothetical protein ABW136_13335 [Steroidobacteraceae bacterium]